VCVCVLVLKCTWVLDCIKHLFCVSRAGTREVHNKLEKNRLVIINFSLLLLVSNHQE